MSVSSRRMGWPLLFCALLPAGALAADATPDQAQALESQLRTAVQASLGTAFTLPDRPIRLMPDGDHYDVTIPLGGDSQALTATARQGAGSAWTIGAITLPSPASFTFDAPQAAALKPGMPTRLHVATKIAEQEASAVYDPSLATGSSLQGKYRGVRVEIEGLDQHQVQHYDLYAFSVASSPATDGKIDLTETADITGYSTEAHSTNAPDLHVLARHLGLQGHVAALSLPQATAVGQALAGVYGGMLASLSAKSLEKPDLAMLHRLVEASRDVLTGFDFTQTVEGLQVDAGGLGVGIDHASLGLAASSPTEMLATHLDLAIAGLSVPSVTQAEGGDLIPRHLSIRPVVTGLSLHDLRELALSATEPDANFGDTMIQLAALFTHGGIGLALENIALDLGPAEIAGAVHATVNGLARNSGEGRLTATGFDALITRLKQVPDASDMLPVMEMIRQMARPEGDTLVWDLSLQNNHLLVNGVDVFGLGKTRKL